MFKLSRAAEYAIRGILHLSLEVNVHRSGIEEISKAQDVPAPYLAKIFQSLVRKGFVKSYRGADGGFTLIRSPKDINLLEVIEAVEGPIFLNDCLIHSGYCPRDTICPVHEVWREAQKRLINYLEKCTFEGLTVSARKKYIK